MSERILRLPEVMARSGLRRSVIYDLMQAGDFPKNLQLSPRAMGWRESEVDAWIANLPPSPTGAEAITAKAVKAKAQKREQKQGASHA